MKNKLINIVIPISFVLIALLMFSIQPYIEFIFYDQEEIVLEDQELLLSFNNDTDSFLIKTKEKAFFNKVEELLNLKYPDFIVQILLQSKNLWTYTLNDETIYIKFNISSKNEIINSLDLTIYYNEIKNYINISYKPNLLYENEDGFDYKKDKKTVAFTFDDGPHKEYTSKLIDVLYKNKAKATFFLLGVNMNKYPDIVKELANSNNEIGTHTYNHKNFYKISKKSIQHEIESSRKLYNDLTNKEMHLLRPPYGNVNRKIKRYIDYPIILWNVDTIDWKTKNTNYVVNHVLDTIEDGDIILFHDVYSTTLEAIELLLPKLYLMGYQVVDVTTLSQIKNSPLEKGEMYFSFK